jgi:hypothetical protein
MSAQILQLDGQTLKYKVDFMPMFSEMRGPIEIVLESAGVDFDLDLITKFDVTTTHKRL